MFKPEDIQARARQHPFTPFRIRTSDGESFDVAHPELIMIGQRALIIGLASSDQPAYFEQAVRIATMHVTSLEDLPAPPRSEGDGNGRRR